MNSEMFDHIYNIHSIVGYANFGNNANFLLLHFAVQCTMYIKPMIENRYLILFYACKFFSQYQIRLRNFELTL